MWTGWLPFDPILAFIVALNILWSGGKLVRQSVGGLMDEGDPELDRQIRTVLDAETNTRGLHYHQLRHRHSGTGSAHWQATEIEAAIKANSSVPVTVTTTLNPSRSTKRYTKG
ncbi:MAG: hypothetical protein O7D34_00735 [Ignavibacteria bacterium]|nr:hypothetical protein [Ignavibacteria bacterium]